MFNVTITIEDRKFKGQFIKMSIEEYIEFIKGQAELLNIQKGEKPLTRNLERSYPGIKDPGPHPTATFNKGNSNMDSGKPGRDSSNHNIIIKGSELSHSVNNLTLDQLVKGINKAMNKTGCSNSKSVTAPKPNLPPRRNE